MVGIFLGCKKTESRFLISTVSLIYFILKIEAMNIKSYHLVIFIYFLVVV